MPDYLFAARRVRKAEFIAEPGPTKFLTVPDGEVHEPDHAVSKTDWVAAVTDEAIYPYEFDEVTGDPCGDVLIYIHGYNNSLEDVVTRHRLLKRGLVKQGFRGALVSFDWPSASIGINYLEDRADARLTAIRLVDDGITLFTTLQRRGCSINVHLLAHSTGAYIIREAFDDADDRRLIANTNWSVSQVAFIGADVSAQSMRADDSKSSSLYRHCVRLTNYQNPYDSVLKLSNIKRVGVAPRVGRIGLPGGASPKAVNVNCGDHFAGLDEPGDVLGNWSHSWHFYDEAILEDLLWTIEGDVDRHYIPTRLHAEGQLHLNRNT